MNLPNKLSIFRILLVPVFMFFIICPIPNEKVSRIIAAAIFIIASLTDMIDGKIARKYNLITNFGKFIDPLADKFLVFGAILGILATYELKGFVVVATIVFFRELAVTSLRLLVVNNSGNVIAASYLGKIKTVSQMVCIVTILLEPVIFPWFPLFGEKLLLSYITMALMTVMTLWSGIDYIRVYFPAIDSNN